jgi:glycosyltransferase involved in cell wall biosynthesis
MRQRIDLHVHSKYAGRFKLFILDSLEVEECYTEPVALYENLVKRGMTMVTITDHDCIDGCLEIAHLPNVFISEEISARFPENGCIVHVLAYGIDEAQHRELQRLRTNIYELVPYLRQQNILHSLAHPLSPVNHRLTPALLAKSLVLFDTVEVINGQKDPSHDRLMRHLIRKVDRDMLLRWADEAGLEPPDDRIWRITAGSDDHSGLTAARAFTEYVGEPTFAALSHAIRNNLVEVSGWDKTSASYAHTAYAGTFNYFRHSNRQGSKQTYSRLMEVAKGGKLPARMEDLPPVLQRLLPASLETLATKEVPLSGEWLAAEGHTPEVHEDLYGVMFGSLLRAFRASFGTVREAAERVDFEPIIDEIPTMVRLLMLNMPYYFGFRFFNAERRRARVLHASLGLPDTTETEPKVAIFCDTLDNVDGVALGLRRLSKELRDAGRTVYLCGVRFDDGTETVTDDVVRFPSIGSFPIPGYSSYQLGWPSLVEVMRWLDQREIDLVVVTTPGPVGVVALIAAWILGIPIAGQYHTHVAEFAYRLIGDRSVARLVRGYTGWFYGALGEIAVPSHATRHALVEYGIDTARVQVIQRGVDTRRFHPGRADENFWTRRGLSNKQTLLYVGRISQEKNLDAVVEIFKLLRDVHGKDIGLAVVGDGHYRPKVEAALEGQPVVFTGYLHGDELAAAFASSTLFLFPSTTETFGNVVLESLAAGTPAAVSELGGPSEIVQHEQTGLVLPAGHNARWAEQIAALLDDPARLERLAKNARGYAVEHTFARARDATWRFYQRQVERSRLQMREAEVAL